MQWSALRDKVRRSLLHDDTENVWTDDMLADFAGFALDALCAHTALLDSTSYTGDGTTYQFTLPDNLYLSPAEFGLVYTTDPTTDSNQPYYLKPAYTERDISPFDARAYSIWPADTLELGTPPALNVLVGLRYYAYWPHPVDDTDELLVPTWAVTPLSYDIAQHALTYLTLDESDVGSGRQKPDLGQPELNAYRQTQKWWIQLYEMHLARQPRQNRITPPL